MNRRVGARNFRKGLAILDGEGIKVGHENANVTLKKNLQSSKWGSHALVREM